MMKGRSIRKKRGGKGNCMLIFSRVFQLMPFHLDSYLIILWDFLNLRESEKNYVLDEDDYELLQDNNITGFHRPKPVSF